MSYIHNLPEALHPAVQQGFLEREFRDGLSSNLAYRRVADRELFPGHIGETRTLTRAGLKPPAMKKLDPTKDTQLDSGMTPSSWPIEQYTVALQKHGDTLDLNIETSQVAIADLFLRNAKTNGIQAAQTLDRLAQNMLYDAYMGGHTWLLRDDPTSSPIQVNDIRGFETVYVKGKPENVSASYPATIRIGGIPYELIGAARHAENNSTTQESGGISGQLTLRAGAASPDKFKKGTAVVHENAPSLIRAGNCPTTEKLAAKDMLTVQMVLKAMTALKCNTGLKPPFKLFLDSESMLQLYNDPQFQRLYSGQYGSEAMQQGRLTHLLGIDFIDTTESVLQPITKDKGEEIVVRHPILVAQGALIEADFPRAQSEYQQMNSVLTLVDGVAHITRAPINRAGDVISQTWTWIGGFAAPSDSTADKRIIPTANNAYYKRAVVIEHAS